MGLISEAKDSLSKIYHDIADPISEHFSHDPAPSPGNCSKDQVDKKLGRTFDTDEAQYAERRNVAQACNAEEQARLDLENQKNIKATKDKRQSLSETNTEGTLVYCEGKTGAKLLYCENVTARLERQKQSLLETLYKREETDLRNQLIEEVKQASSPALVFKVMIKVNWGPVKKEFGKDTRIGPEAEENHHDVSVPLLGKDVGGTIPGTGITVNVGGGVVVQRPDSKLENDIDKLKNLPKDTAQKKIKEQTDKLSNAVNDAIKKSSPENQ